MKDLKFYLNANTSDLNVSETKEGLKLLAHTRDSFEEYQIVRGSKEYLINTLESFGSDSEGYFTNKQMKEGVLSILRHRIVTYAINLAFKTQMN